MNNHTDKAKTIRFINSRYEELFRIKNGGTIQVTFPDGQFTEKCIYLDDYHTQIGSNVFHICEFAEFLERNGGICEAEPESALTRAAWQLGGREYLLVKRQDNGFSYDLLTRQFLSKMQGSLDKPSLTMNEAREQILEIVGLDKKSRQYVPFDLVKKRSEEVLKESDVTQIEWIGSKYFPGMRTSEHTLTCKIRGEDHVLNYELSRYDDGEGYVIRSDGNDIWESMPETELEKLEAVLSNAVEYGHWKRNIDQAKTIDELQSVRYSLYDTEYPILSKQQIRSLHEMIDRKESALVKKDTKIKEEPAAISELADAAQTQTGPAQQSRPPKRRGR